MNDTWRGTKLTMNDEPLREAVLDGRRRCDLRSQLEGNRETTEEIAETSALGHSDLQN